MTRIGAAPETRRRTLSAMAAVVLALHLAGFGMLVTWAHLHPAGATTVGLGTGMLAYSLGLRHAFDIDHVAAIDNTTRALVARGRRSAAAGLYFSLGHSSVVLVMTLGLCLGLRALYGGVRDGGSAFHRWTGLIGTGVSGGFLLLIGLVNAVFLVNLVRLARDLRVGDVAEADIERQLAGGGLLNRLLARLVRQVDASWKLFPLGVLFGLGFDTATEIALLVLAASSVGSGPAFWAVLSLPLLFAAGMSLLDSVDGALMEAAYRWASGVSVRRVYYNLVVTGLSVAVAVAVGGIEVAQLATDRWGTGGGVWGLVRRVDLGPTGYVVTAAFAAVWVAAVVVRRVVRPERGAASPDEVARPVPVPAYER